MAISKGGPFPSLKKLDLSSNAILVDGAEAIARSSALPALRVLTLNEDLLGDAGAKALGSMTHQLTELDLVSDEIGDGGALALFHAGTLSATKIALQRNLIGSALDVLKTREIHSDSTPGGGFFLDMQYPHGLASLPQPIRPPSASDTALPEAVELEHMHFFGQETGFDYPIFMRPGPAYGNGGARDFYWKDKAHLHVGAYANNDRSTGTQTHEARTRGLITMKRTVYGIWVMNAEFSFEPAYEGYFRPIANAVFASVHYEP